MPRGTPEDVRARFERTQATLERVQRLAHSAGGAGRLEGRVGVITGVGSLKGIGVGGRRRAPVLGGRHGRSPG